MSFKEEFKKAFPPEKNNAPSYERLVDSAKWALEQAEDACMSPTSKGRIRKLLEELGE